MQRHSVNVTPMPDGWAVETTLSAAVLAFLSGGKAEGAAKALCRTAANAGLDVELRIYDRGARLAGFAHYIAAPPAASSRPNPTGSAIL
jgi:hypothetical protein